VNCPPTPAKVMLFLLIVWPVAWDAKHASAQDSTICIDNRFEVPWVHPGITFFLDKNEAICAGETITLQEGETGCFENSMVPIDGSWYLSGLDATTAKCVTICPIVTANIQIRYTSGGAFSCGE